MVHAVLHFMPLNSAVDWRALQRHVQRCQEELVASHRLPTVESVLVEAPSHVYRNESIREGVEHSVIPSSCRCWCWYGSRRCLFWLWSKTYSLIKPSLVWRESSSHSAAGFSSFCLLFSSTPAFSIASIKSSIQRLLLVCPTSHSQPTATCPPRQIRLPYALIKQ